MIPVVIAHLGLDGYGIWSIIMTTAAYMRFGSIGIKSAFQKYVAEAVAKDDYEATSRLLSTGCAIMLIVSTAGLIPAAIFSGRLAIASGIPPQFLASSTKAISLLALIMVISNIGAVYEAIVMGGHRIDLARKIHDVLLRGRGGCHHMPSPLRVWVGRHGFRYGHIGSRVYCVLLFHIEKSCSSNPCEPVFC